MKKIIIIIMSCAFIQNIQSMHSDYVAVSLDQESQSITILSTEGLLMAAQRYKENVELKETITTYDIKPIALTEYFCASQSITIPLEQTPCFVEMCYLYRKYPVKYQQIATEVLEEIGEHDKSPTLLEIHQQLKMLDQENFANVEKKLITSKNTYSKKRNACLKAAIPYTIMGLIAVSELAGIAFFSWVLDNCNH